MKRFPLVAGAALSLLVAPMTVAFAQQGSSPSQAPAGSQVTGRRVARGTVTKIDTKMNEISVETSDGHELMFEVDPTTAQRLKKGDEIEVAVQIKVTRPK